MATTRGRTTTVAKPKTKQDYQRIALSKIGPPGELHRRWLVYGRYKTGKSSFLATVPPRADGKPNVLILDAEQGHGTKALDPAKVKVWKIFKWEDIDEAQRTIQFAELPYEWVGVDNMSRISNMALRRVMRLGEERDLDRIPGQVEKRDYGKAGELVKGLLFNLHTTPANIIYTAGDRFDTGLGWQEEDDDSEQAQGKFVPDLPKGARAALNQIVDVIGRLYVVRTRVVHPKTKKEVEIKQRRLWLSPSDSYDTGYRSQHRLPDYLKGPTVPRLEQLIKEGKI
jgi:hypothetical protein